jgi:hypothetical protein
VKRHKAPWSRTLLATTILATLICLAVAALPWWIPSAPAGAEWSRWLIGSSALVLLLVPACAGSCVLGYSVTAGEILIHRPFRTTRLPRADMVSATCEPHAMRGSIRTFGNGGFFSFTGWYWNKRLGSYRAFVTDPASPVVLRYRNRTVILSPENPGNFVSELNATSTVPPAGMEDEVWDPQATGNRSESR